MLRLKLTGNWSVVATTLFIFLTAKAFKADILSPESKEIFLPHLKGTDIHPVGFSQEAMVMAYNCEGSTKQEAVFLVPLCNRADIIMETNTDMKASNGWLHGMGLPIEYV
jgi:hypothetical protein